jgi:hypothetical protein
MVTVSVETLVRTQPGMGPAATSRSLPEPVRQLHRYILRTFLSTGRPPLPARITAYVQELGLDENQALNYLAATGLIRLDQPGRKITAAVPFSASPTLHRVRLASGLEVYALCAIDTLGIPFMAGQDASITATEPGTGDLIQIERQANQWRWQPRSAVLGFPRACACGPTTHEHASAGCDANTTSASWEDHCAQINFYTTAESAHKHLHQPGLDGLVLDMPQAIAAGEYNFAGLLDRDE